MKTVLTVHIAYDPNYTEISGWTFTVQVYSVPKVHYAQYTQTELSG